MRVRRTFRILPLIAALCAAAIFGCATTLEQLSLTAMIQQSTAIARAKVVGSHAVDRKGQIYTYYQIQVLENLKSITTSTTEVAVPGGALRGVRQMVPGSPELTVGQEYVLFLWTSKAGLTQVIGLSQGLFDITTDAAGTARLARTPSAEPATAAPGQPAPPPAAGSGMSLADLRAQVKQVLGGGK